MMKDDDFKLLRGFADGRTDERTDEQTFVIVESLSRLKIFHTFISYLLSIIIFCTTDNACIAPAGKVFSLELMS